MQDNLFERIENFINNPENQEETSKVLSQDELDMVIMSYIENNEGATEEDIFYAVRWAEDAVVRYQLLQMVLEGKLKMTYTGDPDNFLFKGIDI